jgi:hypothetical protein
MNNNFVQDVGIENAYRHFQQQDVVSFIFHYHPEHDFLTFAQLLHESLLRVKERPGVSFAAGYVTASMTKSEFDQVVIPLVNFGHIRYIHIDRPVELA